MKLYLAGNITKERESYLNNYNQCNRLLSFYYCKNDTFTDYKSVMLDSGAFTFINGRKNKEVDWDAYVERYASFINDKKIDLFMELDIDKLVGYDEVIRLRNKLESLTGKKCIPVWHKSRGKEEYINLCNNYDYVAIGGLVTKEISSDEHIPLLSWCIEEAHKRNCKVHALGFVRQKYMGKLMFDSGDSANWIYSIKVARWFYFENGRLWDVRKIGEDSKKLLINAFDRFLEFSKYLDENY